LPTEWNYIKEHPKIGFNILNCSKQLKNIANIVLYHHEHWDGNGYMSGLKGNAIPLGSRIISICDSIDAMISSPSYRKALSLEECMKEVQENKGTQFDPLSVDSINVLWKKWESIYC